MTTRTEGLINGLMAAAAVFLIFFVMAMLSNANGATAELTWTHPTQRVDNTPITLAEIKETQIDWAKCGVGNVFPVTVEGTKAVPAPGTVTQVANLAYGTWCFRARSVDTGNLVSDNSGTVWRQFVAPPKPPVITTVGGVAWEMKWNGKDGAYLAKVVGTVAPGAACYGLAPALGFNIFPVDRTAVEFDRNVGPNAVIVAECNISDAG